jgi:hypothetical protein
MNATLTISQPLSTSFNPLRTLKRLSIGLLLVALSSAAVAVGFASIGYRLSHDVVEATVMGTRVGSAMLTVQLAAELPEADSLTLDQTALVVLDGAPATASVVAIDGQKVQLSVLLERSGLPSKAELHVPVKHALNLPLASHL